MNRKQRLLDDAIAALPARHRGDGYTLVQGDSFELLKRLPQHSIDLCFADPPYQLSNDGTTCKSGERVSVNKGEWDRSKGAQSDYEFHRDWLHLCRHLLKPSGTIWVTGTHHVAYILGFTMQFLGYHILNHVTWFKSNASPNLACRMFTHSTEQVIWAAPAELNPLPHVFHYDEMKAENGDKQMRDVWTIPATPQSEKKLGAHPTMKPRALLNRIIRCSTDPGAVVLDPFCGSGTTGVEAIANGRQFIGFDLDPEYLDLTQRRIEQARQEINNGAE